MKQAETQSRRQGENPNHHLWNNNGTWFVHFTIYPSEHTKERVRRSLETRCVVEARRRRDVLLSTIPQQQAGEANQALVLTV